MASRSVIRKMCTLCNNIMLSCVDGVKSIPLNISMSLNVSPFCTYDDVLLLMFMGLVNSSTLL